MQTMSRCTIRRAIREDLDTVRHVIERANEQFRGAVGVPEGFFGSYLASAMDVHGRARDGDVLVAELDGRIVGSITFYLDANDEGAPSTFPPDTAGIRATAVDPTARGLGIGRALVEACLQRATDAGATSIALHTAEFMQAAIVLYERAGFRRSPAYDFRTSLFFPSEPDDDVLAIAYVRPIP